MLNDDGSVYMIGADEFVNTYSKMDNPGLKGGNLYRAIPVFGLDMLIERGSVDSLTHEQQRDRYYASFSK